MGKKKQPSVLESVFRRDREVIDRDGEGGEISILKLSNSEYYFKLNSWAAETWKRVDGKKKTSAIVAEISKRSGLSPANVSQHTISLFDSLISEKLIKKV